MNGVHRQQHASSPLEEHQLMARTAQPHAGSGENSYGPSVDGALAHLAIDSLLCDTGYSRGRTGRGPDAVSPGFPAPGMI